MAGNAIVVVIDLGEKTTRVYSNFILVGIEEKLEYTEGNGDDPDRVSISTTTVMLTDKDTCLLIIRTALDLLNKILGKWADEFVGERR